MGFTTTCPVEGSGRTETAQRRASHLGRWNADDVGAKAIKSIGRREKTRARRVEMDLEMEIRS